MYLKACLEYGDFSRVWKGEGLALAVHTALSLHREGHHISKDFLRCILQGCMKKTNLVHGRRVHELMISNGHLPNDCLAEELIRFYISCNSLPAAVQVFQSLPSPGLFAWNAIISAHAKLGHENTALLLYDRMRYHGIEPDKITLLNVLKACGSSGDFENGFLVHAFVVQCRFPYDMVIKNSVIDMYVKCTCLEDAEAVFNDLPEKDIIAWCAMIAGHATYGSSLQALQLFNLMRSKGKTPNQTAFSSVLTACGKTGLLQEGRLIHDQIIICNFDWDSILGNTLVDMYVKCGSLNEACKVFYTLSARNSVTWTTLISGHAQQGNSYSALGLFESMLQQGVKPDKVCYLSLLKACGTVGAIVHGMLLHEETVVDGLDEDMSVGSALLDMYVKCGSICEAQNCFCQLTERDVVTWSTMLLGLAQHGDWKAALRIFNDMEIDGIKPDSVIFAGILKACSRCGLLSEGQRYFQFMIQIYSIIPNSEHYNCLVDLLGRAGHLLEAGDMLNTVPHSQNIMQQTSYITNLRTYGDMNLAPCYSGGTPK